MNNFHHFKVLFTDSVNDSCLNSEEKKSDDIMQRIPEEDHVEGLKFLAERDMRSLHKVSVLFEIT